MAPHATETNGSSSRDALDFTTFSNVIDGKLSSTKETRHGINPATAKPNPEVPVSTREDVDKAVEAAQKAFKPWAKVSYDDRRKAVLAFADALEKEKEGFAKMLVQEQGKPVRSKSSVRPRMGIPLTLRHGLASFCHFRDGLCRECHAHRG